VHLNRVHATSYLQNIQRWCFKKLIPFLALLVYLAVIKEAHDLLPTLIQKGLHWPTVFCRAGKTQLDTNCAFKYLK
jgi:hypothetical protein